MSLLAIENLIALNLNQSKKCNHSNNIKIYTYCIKDLPYKYQNNIKAMYDLAVFLLSTSLIYINYFINI